LGCLNPPYFFYVPLCISLTWPAPLPPPDSLLAGVFFSPCHRLKRTLRFNPSQVSPFWPPQRAPPKLLSLFVVPPPSSLTPLLASKWNPFCDHVLLAKMLPRVLSLFPLTAVCPCLFSRFSRSSPPHPPLSFFFRPSSLLLNRAPTSTVAWLFRCLNLPPHPKLSATVFFFFRCAPWFIHSRTRVLLMRLRHCSCSCSMTGPAHLSFCLAFP